MDPTTDEVAVAGRISGAEVINDVCDRIAEKLSKSCDLRQSDSYAGYAAKVTIDLQLMDIDTAQVVAEIVVGSLGAQQPVERIALAVPPVAPEEVEERLGLEPAPSLECSVDASMPETHSAPPKPPKRYYTPRGSAPGTRRS